MVDNTMERPERVQERDPRSPHWTSPQRFQTCQHQPAGMWEVSPQLIPPTSSRVFLLLPKILWNREKSFPLHPVWTLTFRICGHNRCLFLSRQVLCNLSNSYSNWNSSCKLCSQQTQLLAQTHLFHARKCVLYITPAPYNHFANQSDSVDQDCRVQRSWRCVHCHTADRWNRDGNPGSSDCQVHDPNSLTSSPWSPHCREGHGTRYQLSLWAQKN